MNPPIASRRLSGTLSTCASLLLLFSFASAAPAAFATPDPASWKFSFGAGPPNTGFVKVAATDAYTAARGYGFDLGTRPNPDNAPFYFSVTVPEGTYKISVTFGDPSVASDNTVKAECRQLMLERIQTQPGAYATRGFLVNVRNSRLPPPPKNAPGGSAVLLNERELGLLRWDDKLTLEFNGPAPRVASLEIRPDPDARVVYLAGDSTVTDQPYEPFASWGQMLPRFISDIAVANHAESGETLKSFISELRLAKVLGQIKAGDYLFIQFGHNDEKKNWPQTYVEAHTTYQAYLRAFIAEARLRGATPVLVTPMQRRVFDAAGKIKNTHGDYPEAVREVAAAEKVALIDLARTSAAFYEALGPAKAPLAFSAGGKDITHTDNYGAYELAKCVVQAIRDARLPLAGDIAPDFPTFDPTRPDLPDTFDLAVSPLHSNVRPRGN